MTTPSVTVMPIERRTGIDESDSSANTISVDTDETKLRAWLDQHPMPFRIARDPGGRLMDTFTNRGLPTTLWIKKDGTIRLRTTGLPPGADKRLNELAAELVGVEPKPEIVADAKPPPKQ